MVQNYILDPSYYISIFRCVVTGEVLQISTKLLEPEIFLVLFDRLWTEKEDNRGAKDLALLRPGQQVRFKRTENGLWPEAVVTDKLNDRSHMVKARDGTKHRRKRKFIRITESRPHVGFDFMIFILPDQQK